MKPERRRGWPPRRFLLPLDLYPAVKTRPTMGISETVSASTESSNSRNDDSCSGGLTIFYFDFASNLLTECLISEYRVRYSMEGTKENNYITLII